MIIRILGDGQYELSDAALDRLNELDTDVQTAVDRDDATAFAAALTRLLADVRGLGSRIPDTELVSSDLVVPGEDSRIADVAALIGAEGLIPG